MIEQLTNHLWQSTVFAFAIAALIILFRKSGAHVRYWLWFSASIKFFVPFALLIALGRQMAWAPAVREVTSPAVSAVMVRVSEPFVEGASSILTAPPSGARAIDWFGIVLLPAVWTCGFLAIALIRVRLWWRIRGVVRTSTSIELQGMGIPTGMRVRSTAGFLEPGVVGLWRPTLLLPSGLEHDLTPSQLQAVIAHEDRNGLRLTFVRITILTLAALFAFATPIVVGSMTSALPHPSAPAAPTIPSVKRATPSEKPSAIVSYSQGINPPADKPETLTPPAVPPGPEFEEASIRQCDPNNLPPAPEGMRGGGANSFQMTPGRTHALCMTLATLIRTAYGYGPADLEFLNPGGGIGPRGSGGLNFNNVYGLGVEDGVRVRGGPDWVRNDRFSIEAIADGASDPATMRGPMLRALLERRFQLKTHIDNEQVPAFALTVGRSGLKIKPAPEGSCDRLPPPTGGVPNIIINGVHPRSFADVRRGEKPTCGMIGQRNGPNMVYVAGEAPLEALARSLGGNLGRVQVLDKTGISDKFNFIFEFTIDENAPGFAPSPSDIAPSDVPRAATIYTALEEQLGLRLEPAKAPRAFIVIDHLERLSPN